MASESEGGILLCSYAVGDQAAVELPFIPELSIVPSFPGFHNDSQT